jgi:hypothetical protein
MHGFIFLRFIRRTVLLGLVGVSVAGCSTPSKISAERLAAAGVTEGTMYWEAQQRLARQGYQCSVAGAKREHFDCTKTAGFFPTCVLRVTFIADDNNALSNLRVSDPACIGTP